MSDTKDPALASEEGLSSVKSSEDKVDDAHNVKDDSSSSAEGVDKTTNDTKPSSSEFAAANHRSKTMAVARSNETNMNRPPSFISERKSYAEYKYDLLMWSRISDVPKSRQAETIVFNLDGHSIKEKIILNIGEEIVDAEDGIQKLVKYLDTVYKEDDMADAWSKYKKFQRISRTNEGMINDFISEFEKEYILAKKAGCEYNDIILGFRLLEATVLNDTDEIFVLTGVDYPEAKLKKNLYDQMKASLKKFHGRKTIRAEDKMVFDPVLVSNVTEALVAQGWKKPVRRRSTSDPSDMKKGVTWEDSKKNSSSYKGKKNPLDEKGNPRKCFKCDSIFHFIDKCPKAVQKPEISMVAKANKSCLSNTTNVFTLNGHEIVMVTNTEIELCLLVDEAGERAVVDSACSKTVAGRKFIVAYIKKFPTHLRTKIKEVTPSNTVFQFGGGECRISQGKVGLPAMIGSVKTTIVTEMVDAEIPILLGANSLETSKAILDFGEMKAIFFSCEVPLTKIGSGHFCVSILPILCVYQYFSNKLTLFSSSLCSSQHNTCFFLGNLSCD